MTSSVQLSHCDAVFMRLSRIFPAPHVYPSDCDRHTAMRVGMAGLRHKLRHKVLVGPLLVLLSDRPLPRRLRRPLATSLRKKNLRF